MKQNLAQKILSSHLAHGEMKTGEEIAIVIDQTLTQDSTGTMAYLQFEALDIPRVKTKLSVAYIDHNTLQTGPENADDHLYIRTVAAKYGIYFSKPGNGICHQVHLERFAVPGMTLLGSDSHTPTSGGMGMLAIGAGGLDVAAAMAGMPYFLKMPEIVGIHLKGTLQPWVSAKDIILELLRRLTVKGGVGKIFEYLGEGVRTLSVPERATITNMGAELGATSSIFPSDDITASFLKAQGRASSWADLKSDAGADYDDIIEINLDKLVPLAAKPHSPDNVDTVANIGKIPVSQVIAGSCTNSSLMDMMKIRGVLKGRRISDSVSFVVAPGSRQVLNMLAENGMLADIISAGARIIECACGPCIGMGQAPSGGAVTLRTFNRNFEGRSGTPDARVYLVSPETAAVSAISGFLADPREFGNPPSVKMPKRFTVNDNMIIPPSAPDKAGDVIRGPNIRPFPKNRPLPKDVSGRALIRLSDNITTDHIMPSYASLLPYRSNIPYLSDYCLSPCDPGFPERAKAAGGGFIVAGTNYGQGSSREHAALVPLYLGIKAIIAKSFARIHMDNLVNNGILPFVFKNKNDYDLIEQGDDLIIESVHEQIMAGAGIIIKNSTKNTSIHTEVFVSGRQKKIVLAGGLLNYIKKT